MSNQDDNTNLQTSILVVSGICASLNDTEIEQNENWHTTKSPFDNTIIVLTAGAVATTESASKFVSAFNKMMPRNTMSSYIVGYSGLNLGYAYFTPGDLRGVGSAENTFDIVDPSGDLLVDAQTVFNEWAEENSFRSGSTNNLTINLYFTSDALTLAEAI